MTATEYFGWLQETIHHMEEEGLPIQIFTDDLPEELQEQSELYDELNDHISNFFNECITQLPYGSTNPLLREAIAFFESKGIRGTDVDKIVLPENNIYGWDHSILFLSLGANNKQSEILKNFGCSLTYDQNHITSGLHRTSVNLKIGHYNRIFPTEKIPLVGGKRKTRNMASRRFVKSRKFKGGTKPG